MTSIFLIWFDIRTLGVRTYFNSWTLRIWTFWHPYTLAYVKRFKPWKFYWTSFVNTASGLKDKGDNIKDGLKMRFFQLNMVLIWYILYFKLGYNLPEIYEIVPEKMHFLLEKYYVKYFILLPEKQLLLLENFNSFTGKNYRKFS